MASGFSRLPLEILLIILQNVSDLPSLYRFICASGRVNAAFEFEPAPILDKVIARSIPDFRKVAWMIAIMASLSNGIGFDMGLSPQQSKSTSWVGQANSLPAGVPTTALLSHAFDINTQGRRYLLLTAYRIDQLFHICFVTLLQNIHELIFFEKTHTSSNKSFRSGVFFDPAAWWSPSWAERFRVERALWKLFVSWNFKANHLAFPESLMGHMRTEIAPGMEHFSTYGIHVSHEGAEMSCISAAIEEFLGLSPFKFFTMLSSEERKLQIERASIRFSDILKETCHWKFEDPEPPNGWLADQVLHFNHEARSRYWLSWEDHAIRGKFEFEEGGYWFPDYLGLCLWDPGRLFVLRLNYGSALSLNSPRWRLGSFRYVPDTDLGTRWRDVFLEELVRLPEGKRRRIDRRLQDLITLWDNHGPHWGQLDIDQYGRDLERE